MTSQLKVTASLVLGLTLAACGGAGSQKLGSYPQAKIETAEDAKAWASYSAPGMYAAGITPWSMLYASGGSADAGCPVRTDDGVTLRIAGGCTAGTATWSGAFVLERARGSNGEVQDGGFGTYRYEGLSVRAETTCDAGTSATTTSIDGTFTLSGTPTDVAFKVDYAMATAVQGADCGASNQSAAYAYSGTVKNVENVMTWNGSGRAGTQEKGAADVSTKDEVVNSKVCSHEAASGTTHITAGSTKVVLTYDGASKCDSTSTVKWSLNGADQGELTGVSCAAGPRVPGLLALGALGLLLARAARRR